MPRKGENIYKRKDGRWEGRYIKDRTQEGKAIYGYLYASSYRGVKDKMAQIKRCENHILVKDKTNQQSATFKDISSEWIISKEPHIKESTNVKYSNLLNSYILPILGNQIIQNLSYEKIEMFCNELLLTGGSKGKGLSPKTVSDCLSLVRRILQYSSNKGINSLCNTKTVTIKQHPKEMRILSRREQDILCRYLYEHFNERNLGILICLFTGLRIGEICALKWEDISLSERTLYVHRTMQRIYDQNGIEKKTKILISTPKSACSIRTIPLPEELADLLEQCKCPDTAYILTGESYKFMEPRTMQNHFQKVIHECSIDHINFHALRHTFATRCVEVGFDIKSLSEILGHANVNITMNRYVHPSLELKRENMKRLSELIVVK